MFACGHVRFSLLAEGDGSVGQLIGAVLPDAAITAAFSWSDLHELARVKEFADTLTSGSPLDDVLLGVRYHIELDKRAHNSWRGEGGYAYVRQTPQLREAVGKACHVDTDLARILAHNFIETAVDLHLLARQPEVSNRLHHAIDAYDIEVLSSALARWTDTDPQTMRSRLDEFFGLWRRHDSSSIDGMTALWSDLIAVLHTSTFDTPNAAPLDVNHARRAIEMALEITKTDFLEVVTP